MYVFVFACMQVYYVREFVCVHVCVCMHVYMFADSSAGKESTCNAGDPGSIPGPGRSPGEGNGDPLQYACLENSIQCMKVKSESEVAQSFPILRDPMDYSLPGSSIHGIFQARVLEWIAIAFSFMMLPCPLDLNCCLFSP